MIYIRQYQFLRLKTRQGFRVNSLSSKSIFPTNATTGVIYGLENFA